MLATSLSDDFNKIVDGKKYLLTDRSVNRKRQIFLKTILYVLNHMKLLQSNVVQSKTKCYSLIWFIQNLTLHSNVVQSKPMCIVSCVTPLYTVYDIPSRVNIFLRHDIIRLHGCILILSGITFEIQSLNHKKKAGKFSILFLRCLFVTNNRNKRHACPSNSESNELGLGRLCP